MKLSDIAQSPLLENRFFLLLLTLVTLAFFWVLWPYYGAVFWGAVLALLSMPLYLRILRLMPRKRTPAALLTVAIIVVLVILPIGMISVMLAQEAVSVYGRVQTGDLSVSRYFQQIYSALPVWVTDVVDALPRHAELVDLR